MKTFEIKLKDSEERPMTIEAKSKTEAMAEYCKRKNIYFRLALQMQSLVAEEKAKT